MAETIAPDTETLFRDAFALHHQGQGAAAAVLYQRILELDPDHGKALHMLGVVAAQDGALERAAALLERAVASSPQAAGAWRDLGGALLGLGRLEEALSALDRALALRPEMAVAHFRRGSVLADLGRLEAALGSYDAALALDPDDAQAHYNRGIVLVEQRRFALALASYDRALELDPGAVDAHRNRGLALVELQRFAEAVAAFDAALVLLPDDAGLRVQRLDALLRQCRWDGLDDEIAGVAAAVAVPGAVCEPFALLAAIDDPALLRHAAASYVAAHCPTDPRLGPMPDWPAHERLRIGYFSADFRDHALAYLAAELFECHDRARIESFAFSFGPAEDTAMRRRLVAGFDHFLDLREASDLDIACRARALEIDVAIDLGGFTTGAREGIFALRAAPVQAAWLGYPGTLAAPHIDYLFADAEVIQPATRDHYGEKIVYLPHSYQANDRRRPRATTVWSRAMAGLPDAGFVFCCVNDARKILPMVFAIWMRLLRAVPGSVLWLVAEGEAAANLRRAAAAQGVEPVRLVFAPRVDYATHLSRLGLADLFLDTQPYNAHTTASDALWAGVPVLTCPGRGFQARVAASLLRAVGLPELIVADMTEYEALARDLALKPPRLAAIRASLAAARDTAPLFDTPGLARAIEDACYEITRRHRGGLAPADVSVSSRAAR